MSLEQRLTALRFRDRELVRRADSFRRKLYESECACYHRGMGTRDPQQPEGTVKTGLAHFQFEWGPAAGAGDSAAAPAGIPEALFVTHGLAENSDYFFGYLEHAIRGTRPLFEGAPACRHRSLISALEQAPNTWEEFERQLVQLVELVLVRLWHDADPGVKADQADTRAEPVSALPDLEELMLNFEEATSHAATASARGSGKKAKKKAAQKSSEGEAERKRSEAAAKKAREEAERKRTDQEANDVQGDKAQGASSRDAESDDDSAASTRCGSIPDSHAHSDSTSSGPSLTHSRVSSISSVAAVAAHVVPEEAPMRSRPVWISNGLSGDASQWCLVHTVGAPDTFEQQWCSMREADGPAPFEFGGRVDLRLCVRRTFVDIVDGPGAAVQLSRRRSRSLGSQVSSLC